MATNFWKRGEERNGVVYGYFPLVTFRLLGCYEDRDGERVIAWCVQYREKTDDEPWYTEINGIKYYDVESAQRHAENFYEEYYVIGQPV